MSDCENIYLNLPQWDGGSLKIRFIYLVNQTSFRLTECPDQVSGAGSFKNIFPSSKQPENP